MTDRDDERTDADLIAECERDCHGDYPPSAPFTRYKQLLALVRRQQQEMVCMSDQLNTDEKNLTALQAEVGERKRKAKNLRQKVKDLLVAVEDDACIYTKLRDEARALLRERQELEGGEG